MATTMSNNFAIIPHADAMRVLLLKQDGGWTLPRHTEDEPAAINQAIKQLLELEVTVLYCASEQDADSTNGILAQKIYALDNHSRGWQLPPDAWWIGAADLSQLKLAVPEHYKVLEKWFLEAQQSEGDKLRRPWARIGWYDTLLFWLEEHLEKLDYRAIAIEQCEVTDWSCIFRIHAEGGDLYLKCCDPAFPHEAALTQALSQLWPDAIPPVLEIERQQNWMLMRDAGKLLSDDQEKVRDIATWQEIFTSYIRIQKEAVPYRDHLLQQGCPDRRLALLPSLFAEAIADTEMLYIGKKGGITEEQYARLRLLLPKVKGMCDELASYGMPETLHHDDLHSGNILVSGDHYIFFDWAESFIAHPFFSLTIILRYMGYSHDFDARQRALLCEIYLQAWTGYAPIERLRTAFRIAQKLGMFCRGLTWYTYVRQLEPSVREKYAGEWPYWLQLYLKTAP